MDLRKEVQGIASKGNDLSILKGKKVLIYGAGVNGKWVYEQLKQQEDCNIVAFWDDKFVGTIEGIKVLNQQEVSESAFDSDNTVVIVSFLIKNQKSYSTIVEKLCKCGFIKENVVHFIDLLMDTYFNKELLIKNIDDIEKAYQALADEESRTIFENYIKAICQNDADAFSLPSENVQYFDKEIEGLYQKKNGYFVDCGAYIGDTFESFCQEGIELKYIGFEPDMKNFKQLANAVEPFSEKYAPVLFPCATSDENMLVHFSVCSDENVSSVSSAISEEGNTTMPCVKLDDAVRGLPISCIKMDIEGAEYDSLLGAEEIIRKQTPDLAICTYHRTDDMWRLQNLITSFSDKYKFYLRSYNMFSKETVLYAIAE